MPPTEMFTIKLKGEKHTYGIRGSEEHALKETADFLSDVTGFRPEYLMGSSAHLKGMKVGQARDIRPASCSFGEVPGFIVRRTA